MGLTKYFAKPRWDSSDPDRAPPPLPVPPGSPSLQTRPNVSSNIQAAANKLSERARENFTGNYTQNLSPAPSPEKSLIKGAQHRRMQSSHGNGKDLKSYLETMRSGSPERSLSMSDDYFTNGNGPSTPTPMTTRDPVKDAPALKPTTRSPPKPIIGENTPPSATMRALQAMSGDTPLIDITNGGSRSGGDFSELSSQLNKLTSIATGLQTEMAQLSRRSKDNAADLIHLKEATKSRDDDIRQNLRNLVTSPSIAGGASPTLNRSGFAYGLGLLDSKAYSSPPPMPRVASHNSILDREMGSPNPYSVEGAASIAMLEKIIREMNTKDGQERLLSNLSELMNSSRQENTEIKKKVSELAEFIKDKSDNHALIKSDPRSVNGTDPASPNPEAEKLLSKIKDSVSSNGGLTAEVKALIRELRGEILGMGRELGRKLDQVDMSASNVQPPEDPAATKASMQRIVQESMAELRQHLERTIQENAQQSSALVQAQPGANPEEIYSAVKHALSEQDSALVKASQAAGLEKQEILQAVKTACEDFKPEIEPQQFGLEREEILEVLKEGLHDYQASRDVPQTSAIGREEIIGAIHEALSGLSIPQPTMDTDAIKAELLSSIQQGLDEYRSGAAPAIDNEATREAIHHAIKTGLAEHGDSTSRVMEISRDDLFEAVKAGLDGSSIPFGGFGEQVLQQLRELVDGMKMEFRQYSAANGRDTEQVLDAVKDGLESLRSQVESYVDRAQDVTGKDEIVDVVKSGLEQLRADTQAYCAEGPTRGHNEMLDYIRSEFEHLHETIGSQPLERSVNGGLMSDRSDILAAIDAMKSDLGAPRSLNEESSEEVMEAMKEEFIQLKEDILGGSAVHKAEIIEALQDSLDSLHNKLGSVGAVDGANPEDVTSLKDELSHLRDTIASALIKSGAAADKDEILEAVREAVSNMPNQATAAAVPTELLEAIRGEFENLKGSLSGGLPSGGSRADVEEILDTVRLGLDDLRSHVDKKMENPEQHILGGEIMDTLNENLDSLRSDITKSLEKPVDMTVNYEILDTLKEGLASLKSDLETLVSGGRSTSLKGGEIVLAEGAVVGEPARDVSGDVPAATPSQAHAGHLHRSDLEAVEVLLAQIQIKMEAMDQNVQGIPRDATASTFDPAASGTAMKQDLEGMEAMLKELQTTVAEIAAKEKAEVENAVTKADTDAIETLLRNTKDRIDEMVLPDAATAVTQDNLAAVEAVVQSGNDALDALATKFEETAATKNDIAVIEVLAQDLKTALNELKENMPKIDDEAANPTKAALDALGVICTEIKTRVTEMELPDVESLPQKADVEQIQGLINDFRENHDKFTEQYNNDIGVTAKIFDDRRQDSENIVAQMGEIKALVEEFKEESLAKKSDDESLAASHMDKVNEALDEIKERVEGSPSAASDLKALIETVKTEFERAHASLDAMQTQVSEHANTMGEKHGEQKDLIIAGLGEKIDPHFEALSCKYEEAQKAAEDAKLAVEEKAAAQQAVLDSTKEMADELKLSIDTLGTALTGSVATLTEAAEKMGQDSSTVFDKMQEVSTMLGDNHGDTKVEHQVTRDEIAKAVEGITGLQSDLTENHPKFLVSLQELHALVTAHYEHAQKSSEEHGAAIRGISEAQTEAFKTHGEKFDAISALPTLTAFAGEGQVESTLTDAALHEKLDKILEQSAGSGSQAREQIEKLFEVASTSDSAIHEKLDKLLDPESRLVDNTPQLERLNAIHNQVMTSAAEITAFVALQNREITDGRESKEREADEVALLLERRLAQKDTIESEITNLNSEKDTLRTAVEALRAEREALATQKARLNADVSALNTALAIRKEELHAMNARADGLERRIVEGLMDQSRALLLARSVKSARPSSPKKPKGRDLRIPSDVSANTVTSAAPSLQQNHALAMKSVRPAIRREGAAANSAERRIMSLGQISSNVPSGGHNTSTTPSLIGRPGILKRSHSVKTNTSAPRKSSWNTVSSGARNFSPFTPTEEVDKENIDDTLSEISEENASRPGSRGTYGTYDDRRTSASYTNTESGVTYGTGSYADGITPGLSEDGTYGTGSYMTGSELDRRTSLGSNLASMIAGAVREQIGEDDEGMSETGTNLEPRAGSVVANVHDDEDVDEDDADFVEAEETAPVQSSGGKELQLLTDGQEPQTQDFALSPVDGKHEHGVYAPPSDSGLGSDLPTAALEVVEHGGFFEG
ncbi:hypothetical protein MBLNU457_2312t1 [Dothideomycetes sp. NU457]